MLTWAKNATQTTDSAMLLTNSETGRNASQQHTRTEVKSHMEASVTRECQYVHWGGDTHLLIKISYNILMIQLTPTFSH